MRKKIIIVEDDIDTLDIIGYIISDLGHEVIRVSSVFNFKNEQLRQPDLILLDERLGDGYGHNICFALKADPHTRHIPVILLSANLKLEEIARECQANDYLEKPFDITELIGKIEFWLKTLDSDASGIKLS